MTSHYTSADLVLTPRGVRFHGRVFPCSHGKGGYTQNKREGDGATPTGTHRITGMFYRPDRITKPVGWAHPIGPRDLWSDASGTPEYNQHVRAPYNFSHETLRRADPLYDLILVIDWNMHPALTGKGSAIFIHQWRRPGFGTEGCIAFSRTNLRWIAERVMIGTRLIIPHSS